MSGEGQKELKRTGIFANMDDKPKSGNDQSADPASAGAGPLGFNKEKMGQIASQGAEAFGIKKDDAKKESENKEETKERLI